MATLEISNQLMERLQVIAQREQRSVPEILESAVDHLIAQSQPLPQHEQILALLDQWEARPTPPEDWWDEFDAFLNANRFSLKRDDSASS